VAMGRDLVRDPAMSLFDEPLSNPDAKLRQIHREIWRIQTSSRLLGKYSEGYQPHGVGGA
jgi:ABC-type sugar transport system ATPase subunit